MEVNINNYEQLNNINFDDIDEEAFWNSGDEREMLMHKIHIYPAKFPSLIAQKAFLYAKERNVQLTKIGDIFCGCGTVAVEAKREGIDFWGCDINPVAVLLSKAKCNNYNLEIFKNYSKQITDCFQTSENINQYVNANSRLKYWFIEAQYNDLYKLKTAIEIVIENNEYRELFLCIFSSILKSASKWLTKSIKPQIDQDKEIHLVLPLFEKQISFVEKAIKEIDNDGDNSFEIAQENVLEIDNENFLDMIITSPPYVTSYEYADLHQLTSLWLGYANDYTQLRSNSIGSLYNTENMTEIKNLTNTAQKIVAQFRKNISKTKSIARYYSDVNGFANKAYSFLRQNGLCVFVIGDTEYKNIKIQNARCLCEAMLNSGFQIEGISKRRINNKFLPSHRDERGKFTSDVTKRKIYSQEYIIIGRK